MHQLGILKQLRHFYNSIGQHLYRTNTEIQRNVAGNGMGGFGDGPRTIMNTGVDSYMNGKVSNLVFPYSFHSRALKNCF